MEQISFIKHAVFLRADIRPLPRHREAGISAQHAAGNDQVAELLRQGDLHSETHVTLMQVHGNRCVTVTRQNASRLSSSPGDCLITAEHAIAIAIKTADCFPLILVNMKQRVVSCIHAGWRGIAKGIIHACVNTMAEEFSCNPEETLCAFGPGIEQCCYEVNEDAIEFFRENHVDVNPFLSRDRRGRFRLSLRSIVTEQLRSQGIQDRNILCTELCSYCSDLNLPSFRRDGLQGKRTLSAIMLL